MFKWIRLVRWIKKMREKHGGVEPNRDPDGVPFRFNTNCNGIIFFVNIKDPDEEDKIQFPY